MLGYLRRHHMGILALFVALGGTSYAATQLSSNSVGTRQIRAGAVSTANIRDGAVAPAKLSPVVSAQLRGERPAAKAPWRAPTISTKIAAARQKIVSQRIVTVAANAPWVDTGVSIRPREHLWADTRTDGRWTGNPRFFPYSDANGLPVYPGKYRVDAKAPVLSLIGFVGGSPVTPPEVSVGISARPGGPGGVTDPGFLEIGNNLFDHAPKTSGKIWLRNNDNTNYVSDIGRQVVKVILTANRA